MQTLTEMQNAEATAKEKAWRFEQATDNKAQAERNIARLEARLKVFDDDLAKLNEIAMAVRDLNPEIHGGAGDVRGELQRILARAAKERHQKHSFDKAALDREQKLLDAANATLKALGA